MLTGPTAVGKTEVSLLLAQRLGGEIISADSVQVYRGLDIGSAKVDLHSAVVLFTQRGGPMPEQIGHGCIDHRPYQVGPLPWPLQFTPALAEPAHHSAYCAASNGTGILP